MSTVELPDAVSWRLLSRNIGKQSFKIEPLTVASTQDVADYWETYFIDRFNCIKNGYNIKHGGSNGKHSEETRKKISEGGKGRKFSEESRKRISDAKKGKTAGPMSEETRKRLSDAMRGRKPSAEHIAKMRVDPTREAEIVRAYQEGMLLSKITELFSVSISTISNIVKRNNICKRNNLTKRVRKTGRKRKMNPAQEVEIILAYKDGILLSKIAELFSISNRTICRILTRNNII